MRSRWWRATFGWLIGDRQHRGGAMGGWEELEQEIAGLKAKAERVAEEAAGIDDAWTVEIRERIRKFNAGETKGDSAS